MFGISSVLILFVEFVGTSDSRFHTLTSMPLEQRTVVTATYINQLPVTNCSNVVRNGFLKTQCMIGNHYYYKCSRSYKFYRVRNFSCDSSTVSQICPNDGFYQACGTHNWCKKIKLRPGHISKYAVDADLNHYLACGVPICQAFDSYRISFTSPHEGFIPTKMSWESLRCDGKAGCQNKVNGVSIDEINCKSGESFWCSSPDSFVKIGKESVCNHICECSACSDEANCHNLTVGMTCVGRKYGLTYINPKSICDGKKDCVSGRDELDCGTEVDLPSSCITHSYFDKYGFLTTFIRNLTSKSRCSLPKAAPIDRICRNFEDQMNCSFSTFSPLLCRVNGYPTTVSEYLICTLTSSLNVDICDSGIENSCIEAEPSCKIHKHRLCDNAFDCEFMADESRHFCADLVFHPTNCVRRFSYNKTALGFPRSWVLDGISDCVNDIDEDANAWIRECGHGIFEHYVIASSNMNSSKSCSNSIQLRCPESTQTIDIKRVCKRDKKQNCDFLVCRVSRRQASASVITTAYTQSSTGNLAVVPRLFYCLPGLKNIEMKLGACGVMRIDHQKAVVGLDEIQVKMPLQYASSFLDCSTLFGEVYVFVACTKACRNGTICPINPATASQTCSFFASGTGNLVYGLDQNNKLARIIQTSQGFSTAIFSCRSGLCIPFRKVCDLVDDCTDGSDEENCVNNFKCKKSGEYILLSRKCDGQFDCYDFTDECNEDCSTHVRMYRHESLFVIALSFGLLSTLLNTLALIHGIYEYPSIKTETGLVNKCFVLLIASGDLLQGIFLLVSSINDKYFNTSTCITQFNWTTSHLCNILGAISTIGSLLSLYSMTILSVIRAKKVRSIAAPADGMPKKTALVLTLTTLLIVLTSTSVAVIPLLGFDDYFVHHLTFDENPLFVGKLDKKLLLSVLETYYGRLSIKMKKDLMSWKSIRRLTRKMFANSYVEDSSISFYGSNGFCLFSYFVKSNVQFRWYSIAVLATNLFCVFIIGGSYIFVNAVASKSSSAVKNANKDVLRTNRKLQRKVTLIITTDLLTWVPFICVCFINYLEWIETSGWYFVFTIFFLPINAIVNPIGIYDDTVYRFVRAVFAFLKTKLSWILNWVKKSRTQIVEIEMNEINMAH